MGVWRLFDFGEAALGWGVSREVGSGDASSSSPDFFANFALRARGDSCELGDSLPSPVDFSFTGFVSDAGLGDFLALAECSFSFPDSSFANLARGIAVGAFSGVAEARCFFPALSDAAFAFGVGLGDFFGFGDEVACVSLCSDSSR